jgi:hypothetical protein
MPYLRLSSLFESISLFSTLVVPTSTGRPLIAFFLDLIDDRFPFFALGAVDAVFVVSANARAIGGNGHDIQLVDFAEFLGLGLAVPVMPDSALYSLKKFCSVMVARVCVSSLIGTFSLASGLVQSVGPLPAGHFSAGVFIDDDDFHLPLGPRSTT